MNAMPPVTRSHRWRRRALWLLAATVAGTLDLSFAILLASGRGVRIEHMLQGIASGLLGRSSYDLGGASATLGVACEYAITGLMAGVYFIAARHAAVLNRFPFRSAMVYGLLLYFSMEFVVVPLSAAPFVLTITPIGVMTSLISHLFFVALPIALLAKRAGRAPSP